MTPDDTVLPTLVDLPVDEAERRATDAGWRVRMLGPGAMATMDYRTDRANLEHDESGTVVRAYQG
ncbi:I78 family peptidase inhibitor [Nocardioides bruguierae]|uniref:I78 family peptidase inhibitor n=1 Tax=Nocardioides bruguierae TaxID=2945102 RepID=UPI002021E378|nr:I78 family peptidase inhibitor [Nocardioides bruguierae]MCL8023876.1 I78 family peptidase inhibitor [Nocardioides bruguierae]